MKCVGKAGVVFNDAIAVWLGNNHTGNISGSGSYFDGVEVANTLNGCYFLQVDAMEMGISAHHTQHMCRHCCRHEYLVALL